MKEMLLETRTGTGEDGREYSFDYYLLVDQMNFGDGFACESYGVKVAPTGGGDESSIPHITTSMARIDALLALLTRNFVTPVTLQDVVADWL